MFCGGFYFIRNINITKIVQRKFSKTFINPKMLQKVCLTLMNINRPKSLQSRCLETRAIQTTAKPDGLTQTNEIASKKAAAASSKQQQQQQASSSKQQDGAKPDGLTQTSEIASKHRERQRGDMELFRQLDNRQTNRRTYRAVP